MDRLPQVDEEWQHYKGGVYRICALTWGAEGEDLVLRVIYQAEGGPTFSRPIANFLDPMDGVVRFRLHG